MFSKKKVFWEVTNSYNCQTNVAEMKNNVTIIDQSRSKQVKYSDANDKDLTNVPVFVNF